MTFSQFCGDSYDTDVSERFIEYLQHCFRTYIHFVVIGRRGSWVTPAREVRRLYTLDSIPDIGSTSLPALFNATPAAQATSVLPASSTTSAPDPTGSVQNIHASPEGAGSGLAITDNYVPTISIHQIGESVLPVHALLTNTPQDSVPPNALVVGSDVTPSSAAEAMEDGVLSGNSTLPEIFDVGMEDSAAPMTGPLVIIDHPTGEIIEQPPPPNPATILINHPVGEVVEQPPPPDPAIVLVDTPPELLSADEDVRPQWLMTAVGFLRCVLCFGNLGRVVDLWLAQEARLGYPRRVCAFS